MENYQEIIKKNKTGTIVKTALLYLGLTLWSIVVLFPFYWMILTSVKSYSSYNA